VTASSYQMVGRLAHASPIAVATAPVTNAHAQRRTRPVSPPSDWCFAPNG